MDFSDDSVRVNILSVSLDDTIASVIFRKNKREAGNYVKSLCDMITELEERPTTSSDAARLAEKKAQLSAVFDRLLDPSKTVVNDWESIDWCKWLIASGCTPEEFSKTVKHYDNAQTCGLVWTPNFVAYRCRTCGLSPCMSLCSECFLSGNHEGHDFNMFRSQAGGACDCGDKSVMKETGFCDRHGTSVGSSKPVAPSKLLTVMDKMLPYLFFRLICHFRSSRSTSREPLTSDKVMDQAELLINLLQSLSDMGAAARKVITKTILSIDIYKSLFEEEKDNATSYMRQCTACYKDTIKSLESICQDYEAEFFECPERNTSLSHSSLLEELTFWLVFFEFPQKLVTFQLSMLPDEDYKQAFADAFVMHYSRMATLLVAQRDLEQTSNRMIHISVQLLSNGELALRLADDHKFLRLMVVCLNKMIQRCVARSQVHNHNDNEHMVTNCSHQIMQNHNYWALISDLHNLLSHEGIAKQFLRDPHLVDLWCSGFLSTFQGMNLNKRQLEEHVQVESRTYYAAFTAEIEACASTMWILLQHCQSTDNCLLYMLQSLSSALQEWFDSIKFVPDSCWKASPLEITFHLPLHRYYAAFLCHGIRQNANILLSESFLRQLMMHPLQIQVARSEIACNMWVRNGSAIRYQSSLYAQSHFCAGFVDLDLYLLQVCAANVNPDWFVLTVFERFHLVNWLSFSRAKPLKPFLRHEWEMPMVEGALRLIATVASNTLNIGMSEADATRLELATLLSMGDKTHSQLMDQIPDKGTISTNSTFEQILTLVADYKAPQFDSGSTLKQGTYVPKDIVWEKDFNPLFVYLRALQVKEYQAALDKYFDHIKKTGKYKEKGAPWAPFRLPGPVLPVYETICRILHCRSTLAIIYTIIYRYLRDESSTIISEEGLSLAIYILYMAVHLLPQSSPVSDYAQSHGISRNYSTVLDLQFCGWFGNCFLNNLCHRIERVLVVDNLPGLTRSILNETDSDLPDLIRLRAKLKETSTVQSSEMRGTLTTVARTPDIPFIDGDIDADSEVDFYYFRIMACLPSSVRQKYLPPTQLRPALTYGDVPGTSSEPYVTEAVTEESSCASTDEAEEVMEDIIDNTKDGSRKSSFCLASAQQVQHPDSSEDEEMDTTTSPSYLTPHPPPVMMESSELPSTASDVGSSDVSSSSGSSVPSNSKITTSIVLSRPSSLVFGGARILHRCMRPQFRQLPKSRDQMRLPKSSDPKKALPSPSVQVTETGNESILSLLVQLYNKLSGDNYKPLNMETEKSEQEAVPSFVHGNGPMFIRSILERVSSISDQCKSEIETTVNFLQPSTSFAGKPVDSKEEKRKAARERQQKLMAQFSSKQKAVLQQLINKETEELPSADSPKDDGRLECVICSNQSEPSLDRSIGLIVLIQATTVLSKQRPQNTDCAGITRGHVYNMNLSALKKFDTVSVANSLCSSAGTVVVQTCGHYVHSECHASYMDALKRDQQQLANSVLNVAAGEFACPLCRQMANSVLPIIPSTVFRTILPQKLSSDNRKFAEHIFAFLEPSAKMTADLFTSTSRSVVQRGLRRQTIDTPTPEETDLSLAVNTFSNLLQCATYKHFFNSDHLAMFLIGTVRTNLELILMWKDLKIFQPKRCCLGRLIEIVAAELAEMSPPEPGFYQLLWSRLCGISCSVSDSCLTVLEADVPMLLKDSHLILLQLILNCIDSNRNADIFELIFKATFNLHFVQSCVNVVFCMRSSVRTALLESSEIPENNFDRLEQLFVFVLRKFDLAHVFDLSLDEENSCSFSETKTIADLVKDACEQCIPFLRFAEALKFFVYGIDQNFENVSLNFVELLDRCQSTSVSGTDNSVNSMADSYKRYRLHWVEQGVVSSWLNELLSQGMAKVPILREVLTQPMLYSPTKLIQLPAQYDILFQKWHRAPCEKCCKSPKEALLCLTCGRLLCYKDQCCSSHSLSEIEMHTVDCGAGTGVYLWIHTTLVLIVRGKRVAQWGSLYLDSFGEEDFGLRRGKPLFLSQERFNLLEQQWQLHLFDWVCRNWTWLSQNPATANVIIL